MKEQSNSPWQWSIWQPLVLGVVLALGMLIGFRMNSSGTSSNSYQKPSTDVGQIEEILRKVEVRYVDEVPREELIQAAIDGILERLDPHSSYIKKENLEDVNDSLNGSFVGIGIEFLTRRDTIIVLTVIPEGPSEGSGLLAGDKIISIGDSIVSGQNKSNESIRQAFKGKKGEIARVVVLRNGELMKIDIERDQVPLESLDAAYMIDSRVGYFKLSRFSATTYDEFINALQPMAEEQNLDDLIIDLRGNSGGYLREAVRVLNQLFSQKRLLVFTDGRIVGKREYNSDGRMIFDIDQVIILIDEGSASASEIVAGAIQDWDRGVLIGRRTYGKGLVQEQYPLRDSSAVRLTVSRYYTPSGRSIQKNYDDLDDYLKEIESRFETGEISNDSTLIAQSDSTKFYTSNGRVVYGGGGISPDIYIPIDSIDLDAMVSSISAHSRDFAVDYAEGKVAPQSLENWLKRSLKEMPLDDLLRSYASEVNGGIIPQLDNQQSRRVRISLKAALAYRYFGAKGSIQVNNQYDVIVKRAIEEAKK